ncbi:MAG: DUF1583 domain-containing protein [Planctomycetes bacterium]|nr:DUF1583 domain-containing protein [Planctomycetota bacterium]
MTTISLENFTPVVRNTHAFPEPGDNRRLIHMCRHSLIVLLCSVVLTTTTVSPLRAEEFYQDFRGGQFDPDSLALVGKNTNQFMDLDKDGLHIVQMEEDRVLYPHGCSPRFTIQGDFEITASFEILQLPKPSRGYGAGVSLRVLTEKPIGNGATVARFHHPKKGQTFVTDVARTVGGKRTHDSKFDPAAASTGKLRLTRTGPTVRFFAAEGDSQQFRELNQADFGTDDVNHMIIEGLTGTAPCTLDARFLDLRISAEAFASEGPAGTRGAWNWTIFAWAAGICVLGYALYRWRRTKA